MILYQMDEVRQSASNDTTAGAVGIGLGRPVRQVFEGLVGGGLRTMGPSLETAGVRLL
jgi:hypothetical protein